MKKRTSKLLGITIAGLGVALSGQAMAASVSSAAAVKIAGLFQVDAASFSGDTANGFDDSVQVRRASLAFKGDFSNDWSYQVGLDLLDITRNKTGGMGYTWLGYSGFPAFVALGRVGLPHGLENWMSSSATLFAERANVASSLAPPDVLGLYGEYAQGDFSFAAAIGTPDAHNDNDALGDDPVMWSARATFSPMHTDGNALHFGASYWRQQVKAGAAYGTMTAGTEARARSTPSTIASVNRAARTVDYVSDWGLEVGGVWGPLSAQGEYQNYLVHGSNTTKDLNFPGYYVQAGYVLTGESHSYDQASGTFGNVKPSCIPCGAWEVAVRYSMLDLSDRANKSDESGNLGTYIDTANSTADSNPLPGVTRNWTLGLNWYATNNVKFMLNYVHADVDYAREVKNLGQKDRNINVYDLRAQVKF